MYLYFVSDYPLAVKLGTITKDGKADVYSYDEDSMVEDTNLIAHLAHFGINIAHMEKVKQLGIVSSSECLLFGVMKLTINNQIYSYLWMNLEIIVRK
jgi:hypothetical protein